MKFLYISWFVISFFCPPLLAEELKNLEEGPKIVSLDVGDIGGGTVVVSWEVLPSPSPIEMVSLAVDLEFEDWDESQVTNMMTSSGMVSIHVDPSTHTLYFMAHDAEDNISTKTLRFLNQQIPIHKFAVKAHYDPAFELKIQEKLNRIRKLLEKEPKSNVDQLLRDNSDFDFMMLQAMGNQDPNGLQEILISRVLDAREEWRLRAICAEALTYSSRYSIVKPLTKVLSDKNENVQLRIAAVRGLSGIAGMSWESRQAFEDVLRSTDSPGDLVEAALHALGDYGVNNVDFLLKFSNIDLTTSKKIIGDHRSDVLSAIVRSRDTHGLEAAVRIYELVPSDSSDAFWLTDDLGRVHPSLLKPWKDRILKRLLDISYAKKQMFREVIKLLGALQDRKAVKRLIEYLDEPDSELPACFSAEELGKSGQKIALLPLQRLRNNLPKDKRFSRRYAYWKTGQRDQCIDNLGKAIETLQGIN